MQNLKDKLVEAGVVRPDYRPGESVEQHAARVQKETVERAQRVKAAVGSQAIEAGGDRTFFFTTRSGKLKRVSVNEEKEKKLQSGQLAIVDLPDHPSFPWAIVPRPVAEAVLAIDPKAIRFYVRSGSEQIGCR